MEKLLTYKQSRYKNLRKQLEKCKVSLTPETLHGLRVELKKIKCLYRLLDNCNKNFRYSKHFKPLQKIFRKAGAIRDSDVLQKLYIEFKINKSEKNILKKVHKENQHIASFRQNATENLKVLDKQEERTLKYFKEVNSRELNNYLLKLKNNLTEKIITGFKEDELHDIRKGCKEIIYLSRLSTGLFSAARIKLYDKLQDAIGQWHDKIVLIESLEDDKKEDHKKSILKIKAACIKDIKKIKPMISKTSKK